MKPKPEKTDSSSNYIGGKNVVREALAAAQPILKLFIANGSRHAFQLIIEQARLQHIPVRELDRRQLNDLIGNDGHQGIVAAIGAVTYASINDILSISSSKNEPAFIALLDEIQDPHNLGAIIRSADAMGVHGIVIPKDRSAGLSQTVVKTSAGATAHVPVARVQNLARTLDELKDQGLWIAGLDQAGNQAIASIDRTLPLGLVIGSEGAGIRRLVREKCDFLVNIPMHGRINSLNASVAAGIAFWEIRRLRIQK
ncbi:23S rRNA (guanosine(2251)-2'-O)-methyltransferase RlmB [candidate division KSB1 bacterium]|nr:23S rRNA (guanosine(2251)-2'-O)-methyltransferase RlmB [candidate division KSB1 bacterium]